MEAEAIMVGDRTIGGETIHLKRVKTEETRLTSWEEYNYILVGLVDELINLGASYKLKKMTLKIWARYLQGTEAAFFSLHDECLPKLPANYQKRDAEILYNKHHKRRKRRRTSCSSVETAETKSSNGKADSVIKSFNVSKILKKTKVGRIINQLIPIKRSQFQEELARIQYEDYKKSEDESSSVATALATSSNTSHTSDNISLNLQFTRTARKQLKRKMPKKHIVKHESDYEDALDCHREWTKVKQADKLESLSNTVLISILLLALNLIEDDIQAADLIRFLREGHLSYFNVQRFLPENVKQEQSRAFEHLSRRGFFNHYFLRETTAKLCRDMAIPEMIRPNLFALMCRYVDELGLPDEFKSMLEQFIRLHPPEMNFNQEIGYSSSCPNYEGRAISYIIFILKLLFGIDDDRETKISDSARELNKLIPEDKSLRLFVIDDWLQMLKMRRMVVQKYHMPTAVIRIGDDDLVPCVTIMDYIR